MSRDCEEFQNVAAAVRSEWVKLGGWQTAANKQLASGWQAGRQRANSCPQILKSKYHDAL